MVTFTIPNYVCGTLHQVFSIGLFLLQVPGPRRGEIVRQIGDALRQKKTPLGKLVRLHVTFEIEAYCLPPPLPLSSRWKLERFFRKVWVKFRNTLTCVTTLWGCRECSGGKSCHQNVRTTILVSLVCAHRVLMLFLHNRSADLREIWRGYNT